MLHHFPTVNHTGFCAPHRTPPRVLLIFLQTFRECVRLFALTLVHGWPCQFPRPLSLAHHSGPASVTHGEPSTRGGNPRLDLDLSNFFFYYYLLFTGKMSRKSMAQSEIKSTAPFQPSKLRNSIINSDSPARPSAGHHRTYGRHTPQDEPRIPRSQPTSGLRPTSSMSLSSTTSNLERHLSAREQRLSMLNRSRTVIDDDSASESESWTVRAERRRSLARQLASPSLRDVADAPPRAELPRRSVSATQVRHTLPKPSSRPVSHVASRMMDDVKQEKYTTDLEMASRVLQIWEAMAKGLDELSRSTDGCQPTGAVRPQKYAEPPTDLSGLMISAPQESVVRYPCPFRKRNPARFNIRDHESCAKAPFNSMVDLR